MRSLTVFLLIGAVLYGSFCAVSAKANLPLRTRVGLGGAQAVAFDASVPAPDTLSCHGTSQAKSATNVPSPTGDCCEANFDLAVSSWSLDDTTLLLLVSYFLVPDFVSEDRDLRVSARLEKPTDPTDFPSLQILHARFLI